MTAAAVPRHLAVGLISIGLLFLVVAPWVTGVVIAAALVILMSTGVAPRRMIAFRADQVVITLGAVPGRGAGGPLSTPASAPAWAFRGRAQGLAPCSRGPQMRQVQQLSDGF
jgi:hypothetical protein